MELKVQIPTIHFYVKKQTQKIIFSALLLILGTPLVVFYFPLLTNSLVGMSFLNLFSYWQTRKSYQQFFEENKKWIDNPDKKYFFEQLELSLEKEIRDKKLLLDIYNRKLEILEELASLFKESQENLIDKEEELGSLEKQEQAISLRAILESMASQLDLASTNEPPIQKKKKL